MAETINVSNCELLVKSIINPGGLPNRTAIQGYFLTITNPSSSDLEIELSFIANTSNFTSSPFAAFWDVDGINQELAALPFPPEITCLRIYNFNLPALDTGLFLLLPDIRQPRVVATRNTEIRGYVRLSIPSASPVDDLGDIRTLLLSAQQRGTFLPQGDIVPSNASDFYQQAYSLPLANGGSEVTLQVDLAELDTPPSISLPPRQAIFDAIEKAPNFLSSISSDPFLQRISNLEPDEQRQMLNILLEKFNVRQVR